MDHDLTEKPLLLAGTIHINSHPTPQDFATPSVGTQVLLPLCLQQSISYLVLLRLNMHIQKEHWFDTIHLLKAYQIQNYPLPAQPPALVLASAPDPAFL